MGTWHDDESCRYIMGGGADSKTPCGYPSDSHCRKHSDGTREAMGCGKWHDHEYMARRFRMGPTIDLFADLFPDEECRSDKDRGGWWITRRTQP